MSDATMIPPPAPLDGTEAAAPEPFRASHTDGFPDLLRSRGVSLLVTTDHAGKLVLPRRFPEVVNDEARLTNSFVVSTEVLPEVSDAVRGGREGAG